jgi:hypothetical protein
MTVFSIDDIETVEIILRTSWHSTLVKVYGQMVGGIYQTYCYGLPKQLRLLTLTGFPSVIHRQLVEFC